MSIAIRQFFYFCRIPVIAGLALGATGCGGGSGAAAEPAVITAATAIAIAGTANGAVDSTYSVGDFSGDFVAGVTIAPAAATFNLTDFAKQQLLELSHAGARGIVPGTVAQAATVAITESCAVSGNVVLTINDVNNNSVLDSGDTITLTYNDCRGIGDRYNGSLSITGFELTGNPEIALTPWHMAATFSFSDLTIVEAGATHRIRGALSFTAGTTDGIRESGTISANVLGVTADDVANTLNTFAIEYTVDASTNAYTVAAAGTLDNSRHGLITVTTPTVFQGVEPDHSSSGVMKIAGANNASITLIALDSVNVRLDIDEDGDAIADTTIDTTWAALEAD